MGDQCENLLAWWHQSHCGLWHCFDCLTLACKQNKNNYCYVLKLQKDQLVVFLQNHFQTQKRTTFWNTRCCILVNFNRSGFGEIWWHWSLLVCCYVCYIWPTRHNTFIPQFSAERGILSQAAKFAHFCRISTFSRNFVELGTGRWKRDKCGIFWLGLGIHRKLITNVYVDVICMPWNTRLLLQLKWEGYWKYETYLKYCQFIW